MSDLPLPNGKDLKRRYGISLDQYRALLDAQGGKCAICGKEPTNRPLVVDHDHDTLEIAGLVCLIPCNRRLVQQVRRYLAAPPGGRFGWTVPAELEAKTVERREGNKARAKAKRAVAEQPKQKSESAGHKRLREMTSYHEQTERALAETRAAAHGGEPPPAVGSHGEGDRRNGGGEPASQTRTIWTRWKNKNKVKIE